MGIGRGGNRADQVGLDGSGQFDFLEEIGSGQGQVGSIYMLCFFRSLIDFDWIKDHLISGRVRIGLDQFDFLKKLSQNKFELDLDPDDFFRSDQVLTPREIGISTFSLCQAKYPVQ
jgi:hypothetical protein